MLPSSACTAPTSHVLQAPLTHLNPANNMHYTFSTELSHPASNQPRGPCSLAHLNLANTFSLAHCHLAGACRPSCMLTVTHIAYNNSTNAQPALCHMSKPCKHSISVICPWQQATIRQMARAAPMTGLLQHSTTTWYL
jgi:hypothetical protein